MKPGEAEDLRSWGGREAVGRGREQSREAKIPRKRLLTRTGSLSQRLDRYMGLDLPIPQCPWTGIH